MCQIYPTIAVLTVVLAFSLSSPLSSSKNKASKVERKSQEEREPAPVRNEPHAPARSGFFWRRALARTYRPDTMIIAIPAGMSGLPAVLDKTSPPAGVNAWICRGVSCLPPIDDLALLERTLSPDRERA